MFNLGLPVLFFISIINFTIMYWVDKYFLLRFNKTPKNFDERTITFTINTMKMAFLWHLIIGFGMISYDPIITSTKKMSGVLDYFNETTKKYNLVSDENSARF